MTPSRSLLIRGGTIVDGTGGPAYDADVRIRDGCIVEVSAGLKPDGEKEIEAAGHYITPGFVDAHTHFDASVFWDPDCDPMLHHGVTSVISGNCSLSLAPIRPEDRARLSSVFAYIEDMPESAFREGIPWTWTTYSEYQNALRQLKLGVNFGAFVGHTALRQYVMGKDSWERPANEGEREHIATLLDECLCHGAIGLSTSLFDEDADKKPVPSRFADEAEIFALLQVLAYRGRILTFIPNVAHHDTTLRDVEWIARLCRLTGVTATWNGLVHDERKPERSVEILEQATALQLSGARVFPQVSPRSLDIRINWAGGMSFYSLSSWHKVVQAPASEKRALLKDEHWRSLARRDWDAQSRTMIRHRELDKIRIISVSRVELNRWLGLSLAELVAEKQAHPSDVLADWVIDNDLNPGIVGIGVANADPAGVAGLLVHDATVISNSDAGAHVQMMCAAGDTTLTLTRHVRDRGDLTIEQAIRRLTSVPAQLHGLKSRGEIRCGAIADLVIFNLAELAWEDDSLVDDLPGGASRLRRPPAGYSATIVGGVVAQLHGQLTGNYQGTVLMPRSAR